MVPNGAGRETAGKLSTAAKADPGISLLRCAVSPRFFSRHRPAPASDSARRTFARFDSGELGTVAPTSCSGLAEKNSTAPPRLLSDAVSMAPVPCDSTVRPTSSVGIARLMCRPL